MDGLRVGWVVLLVGLAGGSAACEDNAFPERRRAVYGAFEDEVYAVIERELEVMQPRALADARGRMLAAFTDDDRFPGVFVRDALRLAVLPPVDTALRQTLESPETLSLVDDGSMRMGGEFLAGALGRVLDSTRPGGASARVPEALANLASGPQGPNPDALMHLLHRLTNVDRVTIPAHAPLGADPPLEDAPVEWMAGMAALYEREADAVERLHRWVAGELQAYDADAPLPALGATGAGVDPVWEALATPVCDALTDPALAALCREDFEGLGLGAPVFTVDVDLQGVPVRTPAGQGLGEIAPFANVPQLDERRGEDEGVDLGQAFDRLSGGPAFRYEDAKGSTLALMVDAQRRALDKGYLWDLATLMPHLLGERAPDPDAGYPAQDNLLLDFAWAWKELRRYPRWPILLKVQAKLLADGEGLRQLRDVLRALGRARSVVDGRAVLTPKNELFDHLAGGNPLRDLEVGKACGHPAVADDLCSSHWLSCEFPVGEPVGPMSTGVCTATKPTPSLLEELAEPGGWISRTGGVAPERPILRSLLRAMSQDARLLGMSGALARMMEVSVSNDLASVYDVACDEVDSGTLADLHSQGFARSTDWEEEEGRPDPQGLRDDGDPTRSMHQKLMELIYDTNRAPFDPLLAGIEATGVLLIPNEAAFYMDAAVGNVDLSPRYLDGDPEESVLERTLRGAAEAVLCETGAADDDGDSLTPTAEQLNLFMLRDHTSEELFSLESGNPVGNLGFEVRTHLGSALVATVATGALDALRPWIDVFSRHGQQFDEARNIRLPGGRTQVFLDLLSTLHMHYSEHERGGDRAFDPERGRPDADRQFGTGFRRAEPVMVGIVQDPRSNVAGEGPSDVFTTLLRFGGLLDGFEVCLDEDERGGCLQGRTVNAADEVVSFVAWLVDRDAEVRPRPERHEHWGVVQGRTELLNGPMTGRRNPRTRERRPSRLHLLVEALRLFEDRLEAAPEAELAWGHLAPLELVAAVNSTDGASSSLGAPWLVRGLLRLMADQEEAAWRQAECDPWAPEPAGCAARDAELELDYVDTVEFLGSPGLASGAQLFARIRGDDDLRRWVDTALKLNTHLDEDVQRDVAGAWIELAVHVLRVAAQDRDVAEVVRYAGSVLEADAWLGKRVVSTLAGLQAADAGRGAWTALLRNLTADDRTRAVTRFPLRTLKDLVAGAMRSDPASSAPFGAADYRSSAEGMRDFFSDEVSGFQRIVDVAMSRLPRP